MKKKIVRKQIYTIECMEYSDGTNAMKRVCDGFNSIELLGLLDYIREEILKQMKGKIKPDIVERKVIVDKK